MINLLIVDDSETELLILKNIFLRSPDIKIVGCARNGKEAIKLIPSLKPDLITMDIQMPVMDGVEATRLIMSQYAIPIVVISSKLNDAVLRPTFQALEAGALAVIDKPVNITAADFDHESQRMIDIVRSMSEIKPIRRRFNLKRTVEEPRKELLKAVGSTHYAVVVIGVSIGGPQALKNIFSKLPADFPLPIVVVQHMTVGFISGFVQWLNEEIALPVYLAKDHEPLKNGAIYFAPDNYHLIIEEINGELTSILTLGPYVSGFRPSITALFKSVAATCGKHSIGILLTGMGSDGADGLLSLKNAGGHSLIQDAKSAVVFGMAGVAQKMQAVDHVIELDKMAEYLIKITQLN